MFSRVNPSYGNLSNMTTLRFSGMENIEVVREEISEQRMEELADTAAKWWIDKAAKPIFDNGNAMHAYVAKNDFISRYAENITPGLKEKFQGVLKQEILATLRRLAENDTLRAQEIMSYPLKKRQELLERWGENPLVIKTGLCLAVDYAPKDFQIIDYKNDCFSMVESPLSAAARKVSGSMEAFRYPWKSMMDISKDKITVRLGESGKEETILELKD